MLDQYKYTNGTTSQSIITGTGCVAGIIINSHTSGTIKLWDNTAGSGAVIVNTYTLPSGSQVIVFPKPISFYTGLYITVGGTVDYTVLTRTL